MRDFRGSALSGATPAALERYEIALAGFQSWRGDPGADAAAAAREAPQFAMAYVLQAWLLLCSREPDGVRAAGKLLAGAATLAVNSRERMHLAAIAAVIDDDYPRARTILAALSARDPRDVLALQVAHALDYLAGDAARMHQALSAALAHWSDALPGYHAVLAMHAFGLEECGEYGRAEEFALRALERNPRDARAHHVLVHVFEMTGRTERGLSWMADHLPHWAHGTSVATHCWWHMALFQIARGRTDLALALYDRNLRAGRSMAVADLIDASALLWRIALPGTDVGDRWGELAAGWAAHIGDGFCTFSDLHAMMAFVGANDPRRVQALLGDLSARQFSGTRHGQTTRTIGLPAGRALWAFGREDYSTAAELLGMLPDVAHRLGGSQAQRNILQLTLREALRRSRGWPHRLRTAA